MNEEVRDMILSQFQKVDPDVKGMISVEQSVIDQLAVVNRVTMENTGKFVSHHGNRDWF